MANFYLDSESGNDANAGTSFALRWKSISSGATAARIAPGDTIRIMESPDPTAIGNATWNNASNLVTLAAALTQTVTNCETNWTASANVTASLSATNREGSNSQSLAIAAGFTTGKVAYFATGTLNLATYQQISFLLRSNVSPVASGVFEIRLCSDLTGDVAVDTFVIPAIAGLNRWIPIVIDKAAALGSAIASVAIYAASDPGTITLLVDNIIACKASSSDDALTHRDLISKNIAGEAWWSIQSIDGTSVRLSTRGPNATAASSSGTARAYYGTTGSAATSRRRTIRGFNTMNPLSGDAPEIVQDAGTFASPIVFSGGWNRTDMSTQTGHTYWDGQNGLGRGFYMSQGYVTFEKMGFVRYTTAMLLDTGCLLTRLTQVHAVDCEGPGYTMGAVGAILDTCYFSGGLSHGFQSTGYAARFTSCRALSAGGTGFFLNQQNTLADCVSAGSAVSGAYFDNGACTVDRSIFDTNGADILPRAPVHFKDCQFNSATEFNHEATFLDAYCYSHDHDGVAGSHKIAHNFGNIVTEAGADRHTLADIAWKMSPTSTNISTELPLKFPIAHVACVANSLVTVKAWMKRTNSGVSGRLVCKGGQIDGVAADVTASIAAAANTWEELTITFTPTEAAVVEITAEAYGGTTYSVFVDDLTVSQA